MLCFAWMNFLAHLFLSREDGASRVGSVLPDLVRGRLREPMPASMLAGADLHRRVDAFTDLHRSFVASITMVRPAVGLLSGVVMDVWYDHLLTRSWDVLSDASLDGFVDDVYASVAGSIDAAPASARQVLRRIVDDDWLRCYASAEGIAFVFERMSRRIGARLRRPVDLCAAMPLLREHDAALEAHFALFFPDVVRLASGHEAASGRLADVLSRCRDALTTPALPGA